MLSPYGRRRCRKKVCVVNIHHVRGRNFDNMTVLPTYLYYRSKKGFSVFLSIQCNLATFQPQFIPVSKFIKATCYISSSLFIHVLSENDGLIGGLVIWGRDNQAR